MKLVESGVELIMQEPGMKGVNKMIELAGRTCYKSEANITEDSSEAFVERMINSQHLGMLEHGTVYLKVPIEYFNDIVDDHDFNFYDNPYTRWGYTNDRKFICLSTNLRVLYEYHYMDLLKFLHDPTELDFENKHFHRRITIKFIPNIAIAREIRTHRKMSFANESTRWCNYSKDRFDNSVTFIRPVWLKTSDYNAMDDIGRIFYRNCEHCEFDYIRLLKKGLKPEDARDALNLDVKSEIVVTGFALDWREFFDKRLFEKTGRVHPLMLKLATDAKQALADANLWTYVMSQPSKFD